MNTSIVAALRAWPLWRWAAAALVGIGYVVLVGVPTDLIDTPLFGRDVPPTWWSWPALLAFGYAGAMAWFQPVQPLLQALALALLGWALWRRLRNQTACPLPRTQGETVG